MYGCGCRPVCRRRCIGTFTERFRVYENCCYSVYRVCSCCGCEYDYRRFRVCPHCGGYHRGFFGFGRFGMMY